MQSPKSESNEKGKALVVHIIMNMKSFLVVNALSQINMTNPKAFAALKEHVAFEKLLLARSELKSAASCSFIIPVIRYNFLAKSISPFPRPV